MKIRSLIGLVWMFGCLESSEPVSVSKKYTLFPEATARTCMRTSSAMWENQDDSLGSQTTHGTHV